MHLPDTFIAILIHFQPLFSAPSYTKMLRLVCGTLLTRGSRTVTAALKMLGLEKEGHWSKYHHLLNRAQWSSLAVGAVLLRLIVATFVGASGTIEIVVDETLERRWGKQIKKRGHWRDSLASGKGQSVSTSGLRWLVAAVIVKMPFSSRQWALPFFSVLLTTPKVSQELGLRHRTYLDRTRQLVYWLCRLFADRRIKLIADGAYSSIELGLICQWLGVELIAPLRLDARLFETTPPQRKPGRGRPGVFGPRLPSLNQLAQDDISPDQGWELLEVNWYNGATKKLWVLAGSAIWYSNATRCSAPLVIRWVLVRDPHERLTPKGYFSSNVFNKSATSLISDFVKRWSLEVTFEESRAHLGVETQRQWNDQAIERTTPVLFGLYSLVGLFANALYQSGQIELYQTAWYHKTEASFSDLLAAVRRTLWGNFNFLTSSQNEEVSLIPRSILDRLAFAACY